MRRIVAGTSIVLSLVLLSGWRSVGHADCLSVLVSAALADW